MYEWQWRTIWLYKGVFLQGALITIALTGVAIILGTIGGALITFIRQSSNPVFVWLSKIYVELFRAIPILVLLIWIYYVVPILLGWRVTSFTAAVIALSMNLAAFVSETARASIEAIPQSQFESGIALGMSHRETIAHIIIPQAVRNMVPNMMGLYITEIKNSSLASVIAVNETLHRSNILISQTYRPLEIYTAVAVVYLLMILPLVYFSRLVERRLIRGHTPTRPTDYEASH